MAGDDKNPSGSQQQLDDSSGVLARVVKSFESRGEKVADLLFSKKRSPARLAVAYICAIMPLLFIGHEIKQLIAPGHTIYDDGGFYNLTKSNVMWDVFYGRSEPCETMDCHLTADYPSDRYTKQMVLPAREFPLVGYKEGDLIYLRAKVRIPEEVLSRNIPLAFHSLYVWAKRYEFYVDGKILEEGSAETLNITIPRRLIPPSGELTFSVKIDPDGLPYQGIAHRKDLLIGDKDQLKRTAWRSVELTTTYWLWFLIPKITFCFIFAILYIFLSQNRELFSFIVYIFLSSLALFVESAYADFLKGFGLNSSLASPILLCFSDLYLILFFHDYFRREGRLFKTVFVAVMAAFCALILAAVFLLPGKTAVNVALAFEMVFRVAGTFYGLFLSGVTARSLGQSGKSRPRKIIAVILFVVLLGSLVPVSLETIRVAADILNMNFGGFPYMQAFDLILFAVLASITAYEFGMTATLKKQVESELRLMEERMELGRSVQNLILPPRSVGQSAAGARYQFFFDAAQTMAGDWFYIWETADGEARLFTGDVTGKGPPAALAVSAIISCLAGCRDDGLTIDEAISTLNRRVYSLFRGQVMSSMNVTILRAGSGVDLYNFGSVGWVVRRAGEFKMVTVRGSQIGMGEEIQWSRTTLPLEAGDLLFTFTDGVLEGSRPLRKLMNGLATNKDLVSAGDYFNFAVETGRGQVHADDRTMLIINL